MAMQATRLLVVITSGPWLYSWLTRRYGFKKVGGEPPGGPSGPGPGDR
jgi:hypothetical protein